jgi:general secretion pathway protein D
MRRLYIGVSSLLILAGCATSGAFRAGVRSEERHEFDRAVLEYSRALQADPQSSRYRQRLEIARARAATEHALNARRLLARGQTKEALDELRLAYDLNPGDTDVRRQIEALEAQIRDGRREASIGEIKARAHEQDLPGLTLPPAARQPLSLQLSGATLREAYQALGRVAGVNFVFDPLFVDQTVQIDLRDVTFEQALAALASTGRTFHRVSTAGLITVIPDTPAKRREQEQRVVKTFFLSNADIKEAIDILRVALAARQVAPIVGANAITIIDTPEKVRAAERIIATIDKRRAEVVVDVEILEINRSLLKQYGIEITSGIAGVSGIAGGVFSRGIIEEIEKDAQGNIIRDYQGVAVRRERPLTLSDNPYDASNLLVSNLPGVLYRLLRTDSSTRLLANPRLRITEGQSAEARFGDQVPVPVTVFSPIATGGTSQQPITSYEYKNVGVNIDISPRVHHDGDISLVLKLEISSLAGTGYSGLPTFNTRTVKSTIRLREGETNVLAGLISDSERRSMSGVPILSSLPFIGALFSNNQTESAQTDIVMTLTPRILGWPEMTEEDFRSFNFDAEGSALVFEVPASTPSPITPAMPTRETQPEESGPQRPRIEPIRPPTPAPTPIS